MLIDRKRVRRGHEPETLQAARARPRVGRPMGPGGDENVYPPHGLSKAEVEALILAFLEKLVKGELTPPLAKWKKIIGEALEITGVKKIVGEVLTIEQIAKIVGEALTITKVKSVEGEGEGVAGSVKGFEVIRALEVQAGTGIGNAGGALFGGSVGETLENELENNFEPTEPLANFYNLVNSGALLEKTVTLTGFKTHGKANRNGTLLLLFNGNPITEPNSKIEITNEDVRSTGTNRFATPAAETLTPHQAAAFWYVGGLWRMIART